MVMRHGGGRGAEAMSRGAEPREAKLHEGASEPAVDTCLISAVAIRKAPSSPNDCRSPMWNMGALKRICGSKSKTPFTVWNTGYLCGNGCCRLCRGKNTRLAQRYQHYSVTEPSQINIHAGTARITAGESRADTRRAHATIDSAPAALPAFPHARAAADRSPHP